MKDSQQLWLESLPSDVRAEAEADIAKYDHPGVEEYVDINDDWKPSDRFGLTVEFSSQEIETLSKAFGASVEMFEIMHDALMEQAQAVLEERGETDSIAAAD